MKKGLLLIVAMIFSGLVFSQENNSEILLKIDNKEITKSEFERIYKKNNNENTLDKKSLEEYLDLFINFKLKVLEAENLGLDTTKAFKKELKGYRNQLAKPYLTDKNVNEALLKEAYDRMLYDINASHILFTLESDASPEDTLRIYNKIIDLRNRILNGEKFGKIARKHSQDPSAKSNGGNLGFFTAFQMVYPFESVTYNTKVNEVSMPCRTKFGYHIIKVHEKRDAQGEIKVAHIMVATPNSSTPENVAKAKDKISTIFDKLKAGEEFSLLAKESSDDKGSAKKGGELPWFGTGRMVPEFEKAAFALINKGDISEPIKTNFGWHIIKLVDKKGIIPYEDLKAELKNKISRDERANKGRKAIIARLKSEYNYKEYKKNINPLYALIDTSVYTMEWSAEKAKNLNKTLFAFADNKFTQYDFAKYLASKRVRMNMSLNKAVDFYYNVFINETIIKYEESRLEEKYPEFMFLMKEYHDGILLFELTDKMVWSKAIKDSIGLESFHKQNKDNYMWGERAEATIFHCANEKVKAATQKLIAKKEKKGYSNEDILNIINKKNENNLKTETEIYSKGDNDLADFYVWKEGEVKEDNTIFTYKKLAPMPKSLKEARGLITADYQSHLEEKWILELKNKYKVTVNKDVLTHIK